MMYKHGVFFTVLISILVASGTLDAALKSGNIVMIRHVNTNKFLVALGSNGAPVAYPQSSAGSAVAAVAEETASVSDNEFYWEVSGTGAAAAAGSVIPSGSAVTIKSVAYGYFLASNATNPAPVTTGQKQVFGAPAADANAQWLWFAGQDDMFYAIHDATKLRLSSGMVTFQINNMKTNEVLATSVNDANAWFEYDFVADNAASIPVATTQVQEEKPKKAAQPAKKVSTQQKPAQQAQPAVQPTTKQPVPAQSTGRNIYLGRKGVTPAPKK